MPYVIRGRLCGYLCPECPEPMSRVKVRLYRSRAQLDAAAVAALAVASPKETFAVLTDEQVKDKEDRLIAEAEADADGRFTFELGESQRYGGESFEIDVYCGSVPRLPLPKPEPAPLRARQFTITTLQPMWRRTETGYVAAWEYCLPARFWCAIRALFGAWVICGHVTDCKSGASIAGVLVRVFDADWLTDDPLGSATTDAQGHFRIDYTSADFHVTFLSPLINLETPLPPWDSGPDVYFRIETATSTVLLDEDRAEGHKPGRANVGHCLCVDLCVDEPVGGPVDTIPLFTHAGMYRINPGPLPVIKPDGLTSDGDYAFTGTVPLIGIMPDGQNSQDVEYHFRVAEYDAAGVVLGATTDVTAAMIAPTQIGSLEYFDWDAIANSWSVMSAPYFANHVGVAPTTIHRPPAMGGDLTVTLNESVKPGGWIEVPRENALFPGGEGRFVSNTGVLIQLDTTALTNESFDLTAPPPGVRAGDPVPAGSRSRVHFFKLFLEARPVLMPGSILSSNALDKVAISNTRYTQERHPNWAGGVVTMAGVASLNITELTGPGGGCEHVEDEVHATFTAYHPLAGSGRVYFEGNTPPALPAQHTLAFSADGESVSPAGGHLFNFAVQPACAYILWLDLTLRLTSGYGLISGATLQDHIAFCKA